MTTSVIYLGDLIFDLENHKIPTVSQNFLGSRPWFAGDSLTFPDFIMYELLDQHRELDSALCQKYTKLMEFLDRFEKLPKIEVYMKSPRYDSVPTQFWHLSNHYLFQVHEGPHQ